MVLYNKYTDKTHTEKGKYAPNRQAYRPCAIGENDQHFNISNTQGMNIKNQAHRPKL